MKCKHNWVGDEYIQKGVVKLITGKIGEFKEELKEVCSKCGSIRYLEIEEEKGE
jgi:hypothetical protein